jgi:hypothetical protein
LEDDAMAKDPMDDKYAQQFKKHLEQVDVFTLVVLKSHLIMESAIDNVIRSRDCPQRAGLAILVSQSSKYTIRFTSILKLLFLPS